MTSCAAGGTPGPGVIGLLAGGGGAEGGVSAGLPGEGAPATAAGEGVDLHAAAVARQTVGEPSVCPLPPAALGLCDRRPAGRGAGATAGLLHPVRKNRVGRRRVGGAAVETPGYHCGSVANASDRGGIPGIFARLKLQSTGPQSDQRPGLLPLGLGTLCLVSDWSQCREVGL